MAQKQVTFKELEASCRKLRGYEKGRLIMKSRDKVDLAEYRGILELIRKEKGKIDGSR
jgi:hypothetical protein